MFLKKIKYISFILFSVLILPILPACKLVYQKNVKVLEDNKEQSQVATKNSKENDKLIKFEVLEKELQEISQWKNKTIDDMVFDYMQGNRAAIFNFGMLFVTGQNGFDINTDIAYDNFAKSASLGFAPALGEVYFRYLSNNPFLVFVYINLLIAEGHLEFFPSYRNIIDEVPEVIGREIERIASHKRKIIRKNIEKLKDAQSTYFLLEISNITDEDILFDNSYWKNAINGKVPDNLDVWVKTIDNYVRIIDHQGQDAASKIKYLEEMEQ